MLKEKIRHPTEKWLQCPVCGSREIRYLRKKDLNYCRKCGSTLKVDHKRKEVCQTT